MTPQHTHCADRPAVNRLNIIDKNFPFDRLNLAVKQGQAYTIPLLISYALKEKKRYYLGIFPNMGGGLPKSQNFFCKFTKYFFVCQIHSEVLKHVLQMGG